MFPLRRPPPPPRDGDAGAAARVPPALLRLRRLLPAPAERRAVRPQGGAALLPAGLREGDVPDAAGERGFVNQVKLMHPFLNIALFLKTKEEAANFLSHCLGLSLPLNNLPSQAETDLTSCLIIHLPSVD